MRTRRKSFCSSVICAVSLGHCFLYIPAGWWRLLQPTNSPQGKHYLLHPLWRKGTGQQSECFTWVIFFFNSGRNICCGFLWLQINKWVIQSIPSFGTLSRCCTQGWPVSFPCGHLSQRRVVWIACWRCLLLLSCKRKLIEHRLESSNCLLGG